MKRRTKQRLFIFGLIVGLLAVGFFGLGFYLSPQSPLTKADAIVAISGGETNERAAEAIKLYQQGLSQRLIFSGAAQDPSGPSNAMAMKTQAEAAGVPESAITIEEKSTDTQQNAADVKPILQSQNDSSIILVTSPYHQRRASIVFKRELGQSIKIINHSATDLAWRRSRWWTTPHSFALTLSELQKTAFLLLGGHPS